MGTRADFYVGRGLEAEWLGSIAYDGYPDGRPSEPPDPVITATSEAEYRQRVADLLKRCTASTTPDRGWPWPWEDSRTTDYAYAFDAGIWASNFGGPWFDAAYPEPDREDRTKVAVFPDMKARQKVTMGPRSGLIVGYLPK